jgi:thiol:disulfide interchange protein
MYYLLALFACTLLVGCQPTTSDTSPDTPSVSTSDTAPAFTSIAEAKAYASEHDQPLLVVFTGPEWCPPCQAMEAKLFNTPAFKAHTSSWVVHRVIIPRRQTRGIHRILLDEKVQGVPTLRMYTASGNMSHEHSGFLDASLFLQQWN